MSMIFGRQPVMNIEAKKAYLVDVLENANSIENQNYIPMKQIILLIVCLGLTISTYAQSGILSAEVVHDLDKRTINFENLGMPRMVSADDQLRQIQFEYVRNTKNRSIQVDKITFDYELNFLKEETEEIPLEKAKGSKYAKRYRGDEYTIQSVSAGPSRTMKLVVKKQETTYKYNWFTGNYKSTVKELDKIDFKDPGKRKLTYVAHYDNPETGEVVAIAGQPDKYFVIKSYRLLRINSDLEVVSDVELDVKYVQRLLYSGALPSTDDAEATDYVMIFAAAGGKGVYKPKENADPNVQNCTYVRISPDGEVKTKINFDSKTLNWQILGADERDGSVYVYGIGESKNVGEKHQTLTAVIGSGKQDLFQVLKVTGDQVDFVSAPSLDEINAKIEKPQNQKKAKAYSGKSVKFNSMDITASGDLFITAQDYLNLGTKSGPIYGDLFLFHFGPNGNFKRLYSVESTQKGAKNIPTQGTIFEGSDGKLYWFLELLHDVAVRSWTSYTYRADNKVVETNTTVTIPQIQYRAGQFDISSGQLDEFKTLGEGEFFIFPSTPLVKIEGGKKLVFLGYGGEKGRQIWLGKFDPTVL